MNDDDLAKLAEWERLANNATPGPWSPSNGDDHSCMNVYGVTTNGAEVDFSVNTTGRDIVCLTLVQEPPIARHDAWLWEEDAVFIAAARTAVPEMARMVREQVAEMRGRYQPGGRLIGSVELVDPCASCGHKSPEAVGMLFDRDGHLSLQCARCGEWRS